MILSTFWNLKSDSSSYYNWCSDKVKYCTGSSTGSTFRFGSILLSCTLSILNHGYLSGLGYGKFKTQKGLRLVLVCGLFSEKVKHKLFQ